MKCHVAHTALAHRRDEACSRAWIQLSLSLALSLSLPPSLSLQSLDPALSLARSLPLPPSLSLSTYIHTHTYIRANTKYLRGRRIGLPKMGPVRVQSPRWHAGDASSITRMTSSATVACACVRVSVSVSERILEAENETARK